jgi:hypothetical protein
MSQNRTVFPGVGPDEGDYREDRQYQGGNYSRPQRRENNGTVFPGMENIRENVGSGGVHANRRQSSKPLVGFLYSISRTGFGEYWPVHIGPNVIGRSSRCDISLPEGTVSEEHAVLVVRMMKNPQKLDASISDERSSHGTMLNGESISSTRPLECKNGDIITIGECYQLYLVLIDTKSLGLGVAENFIDTSSFEEDDFDYDNRRFDQGRTRNTEDFPPRFIGGSSPHETPTYGGTVGMDENETGGPRRGGTTF